MLAGSKILFHELPSIQIINVLVGRRFTLCGPQLARGHSLPTPVISNSRIEKKNYFVLIHHKLPFKKLTCIFKFFQIKELL